MKQAPRVHNQPGPPARNLLKVSHQMQHLQHRKTTPSSESFESITPNATSPTP